MTSKRFFTVVGMKSPSCAAWGVGRIVLRAIVKPSFCSVTARIDSPKKGMMSSIALTEPFVLRSGQSLLE